LLDAVFPASKPSLPLGLTYVAASLEGAGSFVRIMDAINGGTIGRADQECGSFFSRMPLGDLSRHPQIAASDKLITPGPITYKQDNELKKYRKCLLPGPSISDA